MAQNESLALDERLSDMAAAYETHTTRTLRVANKLWLWEGAVSQAILNLAVVHPGLSDAEVAVVQHLSERLELIKQELMEAFVDEREDYFKMTALVGELT